MIPFYREMDAYSNIVETTPKTVVIDGRFKLIQYHLGYSELYDLEIDPFEQEDISKTHASVVVRLRKLRQNGRKLSLIGIVRKKTLIIIRDNNQYTLLIGTTIMSRYGGRKLECDNAHRITLPVGATMCRLNTNHFSTNVSQSLTAIPMPSWARTARLFIDRFLFDGKHA